MGLKAKETFDASFALDDAAEERLRNLLVSETFSKQARNVLKTPVHPCYRGPHIYLQAASCDVRGAMQQSC